MLPILLAEDSTLYWPNGDLNGLDSARCDSPETAMRRLLTLLQTFLDTSLGQPPSPPPIGLHVHANALTGGYLVLAVTARGAAVYTATREDLALRSLPIPPHPSRSL